MISSPRSMLQRCEHVWGLVIPENRKETGESQGRGHFQDLRVEAWKACPELQTPSTQASIYLSAWPHSLWAHLVVHPVQQSWDHREDGGA